MDLHGLPKFLIGNSMKNCKYCRELIHRYIDGDIIDAEKRLLSGHLSFCGECMEVLDAYSVLRQDIGKNLANGSLCHEVKEPLRSDSSSALGSIISKAWLA